MEGYLRCRCLWVPPMARMVAPQLQRALQSLHQPQLGYPPQKGALPIASRHHSIVRKRGIFFFRKRRDSRPASTTSTRRLGHATDLFRILLSFGISVLIFFLVLFQGPFSSGPSLGRLSSTVGSGRWALSCPLCGRLRPWLC